MKRIGSPVWAGLRKEAGELQRALVSGSIPGRLRVDSGKGLCRIRPVSRRHRQVVRQGSAKPSSPVQIRVAPQRNKPRETGAFSFFNPRFTRFECKSRSRRRSYTAVASSTRETGTRATGPAGKAQSDPLQPRLPGTPQGCARRGLGPSPEHDGFPHRAAARPSRRHEAPRRSLRRGACFRVTY
jgi:hypothetical protein